MYPADIVTEAERHMATVTGGALPADGIVTVGDFVSRVYLPWIKQLKAAPRSQSLSHGLVPFVHLFEVNERNGRCFANYRVTQLGK